MEVGQPVSAWRVNFAQAATRGHFYVRDREYLRQTVGATAILSQRRKLTVDLLNKHLHWRAF